MAEEVRDIISRFAENFKGERLDIELQIDEEGQDAALDLVAKATTDILFCGWISNVMIDYIRFLDTRDKNERFEYPYRSVEVFASEIAPWASNKTWIEAYEQRQEIYPYVRRLFNEAAHSGRVADSKDEVRLELISLTKINPNIFKLRALSGTKETLFLLAILFGASQLYQTVEADRCRREYIDLTEQNTSTLLELARREGRMTNVHAQTEKEIISAMNVSIATCGSALEKMSIQLRGLSQVWLEMTIGKLDKK